MEWVYKKVFRPFDESKTDKIIDNYFISNEAYDEVVETYKQDLVRDDKRNEHWSVNKIHSIINNNTEFGVKRVKIESLIINSLIQKHYGVNSYIIFNLNEKTDNIQDHIDI